MTLLVCLGKTFLNIFSTRTGSRRKLKQRSKRKDLSRIFQICYCLVGKSSKIFWLVCIMMAKKMFHGRMRRHKEKVEK